METTYFSNNRRHIETLKAKLMHLQNQSYQNVPKVEIKQIQDELGKAWQKGRKVLGPKVKIKMGEMEG